MIMVKDLSVNINKKKIIEKINLEVKKGEFVGIVGPNGSGKSTFLKSIYRVLSPNCGSITLNNEDILKMSVKKSSQKMAVVSQETYSGFDFKVEEIVLMGRSPHKKFLDTDNELDYEIVYDSLKKVSMQNFIGRSFHTLSGGEKQRVLLARALAQKTDFLILDEPTNHLDIKYQLQIMNTVKSLDITVLSVLHDLNLAAEYCDRIYMIKNGQVVTSGKPEEVFTKEFIKWVFEVESEIIRHPITGKINITYIP